MKGKRAFFLIGTQFGKWTTIDVPIVKVMNGKRHSFVECKCSCPKETRRLIKVADLVKGHTKSCGCAMFDARHHPLSEEHCHKVSEGMKKAHQEGRAHNIGVCRWNNEPSYPESFFIRVIENNFSDKSYKREYPFVRFSLDFAWPHKKRAIEIDGDQHWRFQEVIDRDKVKDALLKENGWQVLRIRWIDMSKEPHFWIAKAKDFIDSQMAL
ncbi:MAG: DUF559 domain-containing protein [Prevotella sp.]|nr:DUF559 domain-containing protein [Prevotella sp.]